MSRRRSLVLTFAAVAVAAAAWLPLVHLLLRPIANAPDTDGAPSPWARELVPVLAAAALILRLAELTRR